MERVLAYDQAGLDCELGRALGLAEHTRSCLQEGAAAADVEDEPALPACDGRATQPSDHPVACSKRRASAWQRVGEPERGLGVLPLARLTRVRMNRLDGQLRQLGLD